jgi:hypothetical protein
MGVLIKLLSKLGSKYLNTGIGVLIHGCVGAGKIFFLKKRFLVLS